MEQLLLVNPRRKSRKKGSRRRMPAALKRYWATHRRGKHRTRLANPRRRRRHARAAAAPRRRRHRALGRHIHRRIRRNPRLQLGVSGGIIRGALVPGAIGAGGALAVDIVMGYASPYLPAQLQTGWFNIAVKGAAAVGVGMVAGKFLGRERGRVAMLGGLTVVLYGALRAMLATSGIKGLSGLGMHDYTPYRMGAYMPGPTGTPGIRGLGYVSPAATIGSAVALSPQMSGLGAYMRPMNVASAMGDYGDGM